MGNINNLQLLTISSPVMPHGITGLERVKQEFVTRVCVYRLQWAARCHTWQESSSG
jgi:hypothetical protein